MFQKTLKKKLRLEAFTKMIGRITPEKTCLLVTCGDNNGAINYYLREQGGTWRWADVERTGLAEMAALLGEEVRWARYDEIPYPDHHFDYVLSIDVHEHLERPDVFSRELHRVAKEGGRVFITVPGGDQKKLVNRLKNRVGMTKEQYGHVRDGYSTEEVSAMMRAAHIHPVRAVTFSRFFTELIELGINVAYVKILAGRSAADVKKGTIAPQTHDQLKSVEKSYRLYALVYPFFWLCAQLDRLLFFTQGYVVMVEGRKNA